MPALQSFPLLAAVALSIAVPTVAAGTELRTCPFGCRRGYRGWDDNFNPPSEPIMCEEQDRTDKNRKRCYPINKATGKCAGALPNKKGGGDGTHRILCIPPNAPVVTTPAPVVTTPAPDVTTPAPVVTTPAPVVTTPAPDVTTPAPVVTTPAPPALETCPHECARGYGKGAQDSDAEVCEEATSPKGEVARNRKRCYPPGECAFRKTGKLCKPPLPSATRPPGLMLKTCPYECRRGYRVGKLQGRKAKDTDEAVCEEQDIGDAGAKNRNRKRCYPTTMPGGKGVCPPSGPGAGTARVLCKPPSGDDDDDEEPDDDETPAPTLPPTLPPTENATDPTDSNTTDPESEPPTVAPKPYVPAPPAKEPNHIPGQGTCRSLQHVGQPCQSACENIWGKAKKNGGFCGGYCGTGHLCCKRGFKQNTVAKGCDGLIGGKREFQCVCGIKHLRDEHGFPLSYGRRAAPAAREKDEH